MTGQASEETTLEWAINLAVGSITVVTLLYIAMIMYQMQLGRIIIKTELEKAVDEGKGFSSSKRFTIASGSSVSAVLNNKSGKRIKVVAVEIDTTANLEVDIYDNVTISASGNKWIIRNLNLESDYMTSVEVEDGGTYTGGELVHQTIAHGGTKNQAVGSLSEVGEGVIIPPNSNILVQLTNKNTQDVKCSIRFVFYEVD